MKYKIIIPARAGSKRLIGKNSIKIIDKPLIMYTIDFIKDCGYESDTWINSDCNIIKKIALDHGINFFERPKEYSNDFTPTVDVLKNQIEFFDKKNIDFDNLILLQPTSPIRPKNLLSDCIKLFEQSERKSLATFSPLNYKFGTINNSYFIPSNYIPGQRSQDLEKKYFENGLLYISQKKSIMNNQIITEDVYPFINYGIEGLVDIDDQNDLLFAEFLIKKNGK